KRVAIHEASHVMIAWAMNGEVEFVHLDNEGGVTSAQVRAETEDLDWLTLWYAGEAGEVAAFGSAQGGDDEHDDGQSVADALEIKRLIIAISQRIGLDAALDMDRTAHRRALRLARAYARDIDALARELARVG